jgi:Fe-Mn family superoxide dismutase
MMNKRKFIKTSLVAGAAGITVPSLVLPGCSSGKKSDEKGEAIAEEGPAEMKFTLPELPYASDALQKAIDTRTMEIHHGKHHQGYVNKLNAAIEASKPAFDTLEDLLSKAGTLSEGVRNNAGGHYNHSLFWKVLSPDQKEPTSALTDKISDTLGSFEDFKASFINAGLSVFGSGWAWLCLDGNNELFITSTPNQDNPLMDVAEQQGRPILGVDVWEHAYYLKYQNKRGDYLNALFEIINWDQVELNLQNS